MSATLSNLEPAAFREQLSVWISANADALEPFRSRRAGSIEDAFAHDNQLHRMLGEAGWTYYGWPEEMGGRGGTAVLRGILYDELSRAGYIVPEALQIGETIGPMLRAHAPDIAAKEIPAFAAGDRLWCQGFSEPDAGSDMASIRTRATDRGDHFVVNGQKTWVSYGHMANACGLLVRTGTPESRHRGLSILWVEMNAPGVSTRPILAASGRNEFAELFFDDVRVQRSHVIGDVGEGWAVAMHLLQFERGMYGWMRQAGLLKHIDDTLAQLTQRDDPGAHALIADAYLNTLALRLQCRGTVFELAEDKFLGPKISVDKLLLSKAEQSTADACRELTWPALEIDDRPMARDGRADWFFTRAMTILGGAAEIQRDIVSEHLLGLPKGR